MKKYFVAISCTIVFILTYYIFKSSTIDSMRLNIVDAMKEKSILKIKLGHNNYKKLLDTIVKISKDGKITYFEYDEIFEIEDQLKLEDLNNNDIKEVK